MLKNGQTYFKNLAVWTPQDFESMFGHFSTLWNEGLKEDLKNFHKQPWKRRATRILNLFLT